jgi:hypothetical protein
MLPRTLHSTHPALRNVAAAGMGVPPSEAATLNPPYPTREQYARTEAQYRSQLAQHLSQQQQQQQNGSASHPPVRQPPTLMAAMQRTDLTQEARRGILRQIAPRGGAPVKKYKIIFSSDARRDPASTTTQDFVVDVTQDILPVRIYGFELIGYSFPQAEWVIEPTETALPGRHGWCPAPGARCLALICNVLGPQVSAAPAAPPAALGLLAAEAEEAPVEPTALVAELPLPANPVVRVAVLEADDELGLPRRLELTFARRVGSVLAAVAGQREVVLENLQGLPLPTFTLRQGDILDEIRPELVDSKATSSPLPPPEPPLGLEEGEVPQGGEATPDPLRQLTVVAPQLLQWYPPGFEWSGTGGGGGGDGDSAGPWGGVLRVAAPADATDLAALVSAQLRHLIAQRRFYEQASSSAGAPSPILPLAAATLQWDDGRARFSLALQWQDLLGRSRSDQAPLVAVAGDALPGRAGMPAGQPAETGLERLSFDDLAARWTALRSPTIPPALTPDASPVPDNASSEVLIFQALNASANAIRFTANAAGSGGGGPLPTTFQVPVRDAEGTLQLVTVAAGEYHPWGLAAALTTAMRSLPSLAPLQLLVTPIFGEPAPAGVDATYGPTNSLVGFRFDSATGGLFGLAFDLPLDTNPTLLHPARLGFRTLRLDGQASYDPRAFSTGPSQSVTFAAAELGFGLPSPLPAVPYYIPAFSNRRVELFLSAYDAVPAQVKLAPDGPAALPELKLATAALFHHTQRLRIQTALPLASLRLGAVAGVEESSPPAGASAALWQPPITGFSSAQAGPAAVAPPSADELQTLLALLLAPTQTLEALTLAQTCVALFGRAGFDYGGGTSTPQDGELRLALQQQLGAAGGGGAFPTLAQVDALLRALVSWQAVRAASGALFVLTTMLLASPAAPPAASVPGVWAAAAAQFVELAAGGGSVLWASYAREPWSAVFGLLLALVEPPAAYDPLSAAPLLPGTVYTLAESILSASPEVELLGATAFRVTVGAFSGPGPHAVSLDLELSGAVLLPVEHHHHVDATTPDPAFAMVRLQQAAISYDTAQLTPDPAACVGVVDVEVDAASGLVYFTPTANAADAQVAFLVGSAPPSTTPEVVTIQLVDSPALRLGKLLLVVGAGRATVGANALVRAAGTLAHPFDAAAALRSLGAPGGGASVDVLQLIDAGDPGVLDLTSLRVALAPPPLLLLLPVGREALLDSAAQALLAAEDTLAVGRVNLHPYSLDFASTTLDRIRPERMGFLEAEYAVAAPPAAVVDLSVSSVSGASLNPAVLSPELRRTPTGPPGRIGSVVDIERGGPAYLLLSIQINGSVLNEGPLQSSSLHNYSENSALVSISAAADRVRERQLIQATAYVQLNGDGSTLRLLDKQDDRSPVFYPSGMAVNWVRFMVLRPDGTPYNFHGKRTMVSIRFFSESDNPNFIAASAAPAAQQPPQQQH